LAAAEFQYNDKRHVATGKTPFELNFRRHLWKDNLVVLTEFPKLEEFLTRLQRSYNEATKINERSSRKNEEAVQSEKKKSSRIKYWEQCMVREQEYSFEQTLKKAGLKKIWTF